MVAVIFHEEELKTTMKKQAFTSNEVFQSYKIKFPTWL
jgi:hypothetical protein